MPEAADLPEFTFTTFYNVNIKWYQLNSSSAAGKTLLMREILNIIQDCFDRFVFCHPIISIAIFCKDEPVCVQ